MTDIVERLRRYSYQQGTDDEQGQLIAELVDDMHEAADEIERLEADAENLRNTITSIQLSLKERNAEIERLRALEDE